MPTRPGRPSKLTEIIRPAIPATGTPGEPDYRPARPERTAGEVVLEHLATGAYVEEAAQAADISKVTIYAWIDRGAKALEKAARGERLGAEEGRYAEFLNAVERERAMVEVRDLGQLTRLADGIRTTKRVTKTKEGVVVEETVTVEDHAPDPRVLIWRLEHRNPARWHLQHRVELTGAGGGPLEFAAPQVEESLARMQRLHDELEPRRQAKAIEAQSREVVDDVETPEPEAPTA